MKSLSPRIIKLDKMTSLTMLVLLLTAWDITNGLVLNVNKRTVTPHLTENVTMTCNNEDNTAGDSTGIVSVYRIRLSKFSKNSIWKTVASLTMHESLVKSSLTDASVSALVERMDSTFLNVTFKIATDQSIGQFICELDGFDIYDDIISVKTTPVFIRREMASYEELQETVLELKTKEADNINKITLMEKNINEMYKTIDNISSTQHKIAGLIEGLIKGQILTVTENMLESNIAKINSNISRLSDDIAELNDKHQSELSKRSQISITIANLTKNQQAILHERNQISSSIAYLTVQQATIASELSKMPSPTPNTTCCSNTIKISQLDKLSDAWPKGQYLLPESNTGCPNTLATTWEQSYIKISTGPATNSTDETSRDLDLAGNVLQTDEGNSYVLLRSCRMTSGGGGLEWPAGNYCIQGYKYNAMNEDDRYCPSNFHYGEIIFGRYNDGTLDDVINMDVNRLSVNTFIPYCCRQDGSVNVSILLPTLSPFYLYRFGGQCQQVVDMDVTEQWVHIGTGRWGHPNSSFNIYRPDGMSDDTNNTSYKGVKLVMCYYTPRG